MKHLFRTAAVTAALCAAMSMTAFAGQWQQDGTGYWWQDDDGSYPTNTWRWLDGNGDGISECYYFDSRGYMVFDTIINGSQINANGAWVENGQVQSRKSWEAVKYSSDPMEILRTVSDNDDADRVDADFLMTMQMGDGTQSLAVNMTGNMKMQYDGGSNLAYTVDMNMDMGALGSARTNAFYTDGWYYYDISGQKLKMQMDMANALESAGSTNLLSSNDLSYVQNASMVRNGDNTTIYFSADGNALMQAADEILGMSGLSLSNLGVSMGISQYNGEVTVDAGGNITQEKVLMNMTVGDGTENIAMQLYMEMNINAVGDSVVVSIPSTEGYMDMATYMSQIAEQAA